jgi:hypothetical protein
MFEYVCGKQVALHLKATRNTKSEGIVQKIEKIKEQGSPCLLKNAKINPAI